MSQTGTDQKRGLIDDSKLNRIISDSKQRRTRAARDVNKKLPESKPQ